LRKKEGKALIESGWRSVFSACSFVGNRAAWGHVCERKDHRESELSSLQGCQASGSSTGSETSVPLSVPGGLWAARPGSPNTKPPSPTLTSQLVELLLGQGKDGLIQGD